MLSNEEIQAINLLEARTGARANDAVFAGDSVIFVVRKGDLGKAIGRNGSNILGLKKVFDKRVEVVEAADTLEGLLENVFRPVQVNEVRTEEKSGRSVVVVRVNPRNKGLAIGRGGEKISVARVLAKRCFGCDDVRII